MKRRRIKGFENYTISEKGDVFSLITNKQLVQRVGKQGYAYVNLYKDGKKTTKKIHKLVAEAFIKNPNNYSQVNHIDGNKLNNRVNNLEWCSPSYNTFHAYSLGLINLNTEAHIKASRENGKKYRSRKIVLEDLKLGKCYEFESATQCSEEMRFPLSSITSSIRRGNLIYKRFKASYLDNTLATTMDGRK